MSRYYWKAVPDAQRVLNHLTPDELKAFIFEVIETRLDASPARGARIGSVAGHTGHLRLLVDWQDQAETQLWAILFSLMDREDLPPTWRFRPGGRGFWVDWLEVIPDPIPVEMDEGEDEEGPWGRADSAGS
jgi:hypothetical protein